MYVNDIDMEYKCKRCNFTTQYKHSIIRHLKNKTPCETQNEDISRDELLKNLFPKNYDKKTYTCEYCKSLFSHNSTKSKHMSSCKDKPDTNNLIKKIQELEETILKQPQKITNNNNNNNNNNIQQNIVFNLKSFGQENMDYLPNDFLNSCLISNNIVPLIESIHFDCEHPENHNVKIKSLKQDFMQTYVDGNWIVTDKEETLDHLINKGYRVLKYHSRKNNDELIKNNEVDQEELDDVNQWLEKLYEDQKIRKPVKRQLLLLFINNKTMLLTKD